MLSGEVEQKKSRCAISNLTGSDASPIEHTSASTLCFLTALHNIAGRAKLFTVIAGLVQIRGIYTIDRLWYSYWLVGPSLGGIHQSYG